jgi:hypothetical protein
MNTTIDVSGFITDSNLITPKTSFFEQPKFQLSIQPSYDVLEEIEQRIEDIKRMSEDPYSYNKNERGVNAYQHKDKCLKGCNLLFECLQPPRLVGSIKGAMNDGELYGKYVNVVGRIQVMPDGNAYLSVNQVIEQTEPSTEDFS